MPEKTKYAAENFVGKKAMYRLVNQRDMKSSEVISVEVFYALRGPEIFMLNLANGDQVDASNCYFSEPVSATA